MKKILHYAGLGAVLFLIIFFSALRQVNAQADYYQCQEGCADLYDSVYDSIFHDCYTVKEACTWEIINRDTDDGLQYCKGWAAESCWDEINDNCDIPYDACLNQANDAYYSCMDGCEPEVEFDEPAVTIDKPTVVEVPVQVEITPIQYQAPEVELYEEDPSIFEDGEQDCIGDCVDSYLDCTWSCDQTYYGSFDYAPFSSCLAFCSSTESACISRCSGEGESALFDDYYYQPQDIDLYQGIEVDLYDDQNDFYEYQNKLWEAKLNSEVSALKNDFSQEYNNALISATRDLTPEQVSDVRDLSKILRNGLERIKDTATLAGDYKDFNEFLDKNKFGDYGGVSLFADVAGSLIDFADQIEKGASAADAATKATLDNFGVSALNTIPILKAWDIVATAPDKILNVLGFDKDGLTRQVSQFIGKISPSGVIKQTTELMVQDDWEDIGNALAHGWKQVVDAEGVIDTSYEAMKLGFGTMGAGAVALAQGTSDVLGGIMSVGEKGLSFLSSFFNGSSAEYISD